MAKITNPGRALTEADLVNLERSVNMSLPMEYKKLLLESNGGIPTPQTIDIDGMTGSPTDVKVIFGIERQYNSSNVAWNAIMFRDRLPGDMLPIASDSGGNIFGINTSGPSTGSIEYVALDADVPTVHHVAKSIAEFLGKLREFKS